MTLPEDVASALETLIAHCPSDLQTYVDTIRARLLSQDAEIERQKSITNIICDDVSAALLRAGFKDVDGPGEAIDIIRERAELAESRLAAADALLRECLRYLNPHHYPDTIKRIGAHLQGAGDE